MADDTVRPGLSVVLGSRNRIAYLPAAIDSFRASIGECLWYEIIVADANSTDGSIEYLKAQHDVTLILQDWPEFGCGPAMNHCLARARGKYVAFMNDDVVIRGTTLRDAVRVLEDDPTIGQVALPWRPPGVDQYHLDSLWGQRYANFFVMPRELGEKIGWWGEFVHFYGDPNISFSVVDLGFKIFDLETGMVDHFEAPAYDRGGTLQWPEKYDGMADHVRFMNKWHKKYGVI